MLQPAPVIISIHAPTNGATHIQRYHCHLILFQSTLRRTERPVSSVLSSDSQSISIHAPTNGATVITFTVYIFFVYFNPRSDERSDGELDYNIVRSYISIHAPTNGATSTVALNPKTSYFNPRSDERSDSAASTTNRGHTISIHAPTNGATFHIEKLMSPALFQSTLRRTERQISTT